MGQHRAIREAEILARHAHHGQVDKAGQPYAEHPAAVAAITAAEHPDDTAAIVVAWLHDVVEDTAVTLQEIRDRFGDEIASAVDAITRRPNEEPDDYYHRVATNQLALRVKRADLAHNGDPDRMAVLPATTRDRLTAKYRHATAVLDELAGV